MLLLVEHCNIAMSSVCFAAHTVLIVDYRNAAATDSGVTTVYGAKSGMSASGSITRTGLSVLAEAAVEYSRVTFDLFPSEVSRSD